MKRHTIILPFLLPRLTDKAAAQFIELLHELISGIEHHYATQVHRYRKRQQKQEIRYHQHSLSSQFNDPPFWSRSPRPLSVRAPAPHCSTLPHYSTRAPYPRDRSPSITK